MTLRLTVHKMTPGVILALIIIHSAALPALDLHIAPRGAVLFPLGEGSAGAFGTGGGGSVALGLDFSSIWPNRLGIGYTAGLEGAFGVQGVTGAGGNLSLYSGGLRLSVFGYPVSRLFIEGEGSFGAYHGALSGVENAYWYFSAGGGVGFRFSPGFILSLGGGYRYYRNPHAGRVSGEATGGGFQSAANWSGAYAGLTATVVLPLARGGGGGGIDASVEQSLPVTPVFLSLYQGEPAATITLLNRENAEVRNARVSFRAGSYTNSEMSCGEVPYIAKGREAALPLYADFSPELLNFTEAGRILGEIVVKYTMLGEERESVRPAALRVANRNTFDTDDLSALAAFVSPTDPEVMQFSKAVVGMARAGERPDINRNFQFALWLFEALNSAVTMNAADDGAGEIQFPAQTLAYTSGALIDAGLLYANCLETAGIPAALITCGDSLLTAFSTGLSESEAASHFNGLENILVVNDEAWVPVATGALQEGFSAAWKGGSNELNAAFENGDEVGFIILADAWADYPPAPFPSLNTRIAQPGREDVSRAAGAALDSYLKTEIGPLIEKQQAIINAGGGARDINRLAILYLRAGRVREAKAAYERAAGMGSVPAMTNRANLALRENDAAGAEKWLRAALALDPDDEVALQGLKQMGKK